MCSRAALQTPLLHGSHEQIVYVISHAHHQAFKNGRDIIVFQWPSSHCTIAGNYSSPRSGRVDNRRSTARNCSLVYSASRVDDEVPRIPATRRCSSCTSACHSDSAETTLVVGRRMGFEVTFTNACIFLIGRDTIAACHSSSGCHETKERTLLCTAHASAFNNIVCLAA